MDLDLLREPQDMILNDIDSRQMYGDKDYEQVNSAYVPLPTDLTSAQEILDSDAALALIRPNDTSFFAQHFLNHYGSSMCIQISAPDSIQRREDFLRALSVSVAVVAEDANEGFVSSISVRDRGHHYEKPHPKLMKGCFLYTGTHISPMHLHMSRRKLMAGLVCLCRNLMNRLPLTLCNFFYAVINLRHIQRQDLVKFISLHARQWCKRAQVPLYIETIFAKLSESDSGDLAKTLVQALKVIYQRPRHFESVLLRESEYGNILLFEHEGDGRRMYSEHRKRIVITRDSDTLTHSAAIYSAAWNTFNIGMYKETKQLVEQGLLVIDRVGQLQYVSHILAFRRLLAYCSILSGDESSGLQTLDSVIEAAISHRTNYTAEFEEEELDLMAKIIYSPHQKRRDLESATYCKTILDQYTHDSETCMQRLEEMVQNGLVLEPKLSPDRSSATLQDNRGRSQEQGQFSEDRYNQEAWRTGISSSARAVVLTSLYDES